MFVYVSTELRGLMSTTDGPVKSSDLQHMLSKHTLPRLSIVMRTPVDIMHSLTLTLTLSLKLPFEVVRTDHNVQNTKLYKHNLSLSLYVSLYCLYAECVIFLELNIVIILILSEESVQVVKNNYSSSHFCNFSHDLCKSILITT